MNPLFHPTLVNRTFGDPALYIEILHTRQALLFDLGDIRSLREAKILKLSQVCVSHTHMDHFFGFDHLLRVILGRDRALTLFGPLGIIENVAGKLTGYTWNLVNDYLLRIEVREVSPLSIRSATFTCAERFSCREEEERPFEGVLEDTPHFRIEAVHLDHGIPCLAFSLIERLHINVIKERAIQLGFPIGPWLKTLKEFVWEGRPDDEIVRVPAGEGTEGDEREVALGDLKRDILTVTPGQKISYVVDCSYTRENEDKIVELVQGSDLFFCEAAFLEADGDKARAKDHLTARQAGLIAKRAGVKALKVFHFSPRYEQCPEALAEEAHRAFRG